MSMTIDQVEKQVMLWPLQEREELIARLLAHADAEDGVDEAGLAEAERRYEEMRSGQEPGISLEELMSRVRAQLR